MRVIDMRSTLISKIFWIRIMNTAHANQFYRKGKNCALAINFLFHLTASLVQR